METTYKNPWHKPGSHEYGPPYYTTSATPVGYHGYLIYRVRDRGYDVVRDGVCVTQVGSLSAAKQAIDIRRELSCHGCRNTDPEWVKCCPACGGDICDGCEMKQGAICINCDGLEE